MTRLVALVLIMLIVVTSVPVTVNAQTEMDTRAAADTAVELSWYESVGDVNALYDRIHPDVHSVIPRAAVIGWYQNDFLPLGPGVAMVTGVRFVEWTWEVTGQTYPYTAEVSFRQSFANGSVADEVVRLVQDANGEWRWFFGRSREFVEEQIARYAPLPPSVGTGASPVDVAIEDVNTFWSNSFAAANLTYESPDVVAVETFGSSACGAFDVSTGPAFYCPVEQAIYYAPLWFSEFERGFGDFAWVTVMAHEWGHHVQTLLGLRASVGNRYELQADCLAGAYARDAATRGLLDPGDITEAVGVSATYGDPFGLPQDTPGAHGTSDDRITAFFQGYINGFIGCDLPISVGSTAGSDRATGGDSSSSRSAAADDDLAELLPQGRDVPADLEMTGDRQRRLGQVAANYIDPVETEELFAQWEWDGNVTRTFEGDGGESGITYIYVSIHRFGSSSGASRALDYSVDDQLASTDASEVSVSSVGERARAMAITSGTSDEITIYTHQGNVLVRVTVSSADEDPLEEALTVAEVCLRKAE